ncbi:hypothetical protein EJ02DRAFT_461938 [Clathrospora elynae]|uniref:Uncharacterized protein n=1 Tax=Clathrospora elynae TaxID=706981 RepID=A0A6A5T8A3_9PLEO|nr:hypothetical protein EJ02DRAFT_461938 [Clathrospora elynae]
MSWVSSFFNRTPATTPTEDDDWSDISSENEFNCASDNNERPRGDTSVPHDEELRLPPNMPTLLSTDLPPCGLIPQLAYENVNNRLRKLWLQRATKEPVDVPLVGLCNRVREDLEAEAEASPIDSELGIKARKPWRRENVFVYELCWSRYFVRESEVMEKRPKMSAKELEQQEFLEVKYPIPRELKIINKNNLNTKIVIEGWKKWHHGKRGTM